MTSNVHLASGSVIDIMSSVTTTATGNWIFKDRPTTTVQATVAGTGTVTATVIIDVSNDGANACSTVAGTITLSGTTANADGFVIAAPWKYIRARVTAISGTGAAVTVKNCG